MIINDYMVSKSHVWCFPLEIYNFSVSLTYKIYQTHQTLHTLQTLTHTCQNPYPWPGVRVWRVRVGVQLKYPRVTRDNHYVSSTNRQQCLNIVSVNLFHFNVHWYIDTGPRVWWDVVQPQIGLHFSPYNCCVIRRRFPNTIPWRTTWTPREIIKRV